MRDPGESECRSYNVLGKPHRIWIWKYNPNMTMGIRAAAKPVEGASRPGHGTTKTRQSRKLPFAEAIEKEADRWPGSVCRHSIGVILIYMFDRGFTRSGRRCQHLSGESKCLVRLKRRVQDDHEKGTLRRVFGVYTGSMVSVDNRRKRACSKQEFFDPDRQIREIR